MKLLVIIVTYNAMRWAERCFDSLRKSTVKPDVFVVDNGSTDGTQAYIQEHYPEVMFKQSENNLGFGKANNIGLQYAIDNFYDYVYLLNQDAWVMEDTFERLVCLSKQYPDYGIFSPFQMNADMYHIDRNFVSNVLEYKSNPNIVTDLYNQKLLEVYPVAVVMAAHWFLTLECLIKVGGFSPSFPHYAEDYNYIDRLHYFGMKVGIVPSLKVVHDRGWREDDFPKKMQLLYTGFIKILSDPSMSVKKAFVLATYSALLEMFKHKSFQPICRLIKALRYIRFILNNRKLSISTECAFLSKSDNSSSMLSKHS